MIHPIIRLLLLHAIVVGVVATSVGAPPPRALPPAPSRADISQLAESLEPRSPNPECVAPLSALHPCFDYLAYSPDLYSRPSPRCCDIFLPILTAAGPMCVCTLVRYPIIGVYTIDTGRLFSVMTDCGLKSTDETIKWFYASCNAAVEHNKSTSKSSKVWGIVSACCLILITAVGTWSCLRIKRRHRFSSRSKAAQLCRKNWTK